VAGALTAVVGASFVVAPVAGVALYEWVPPTAFLVNARAAIGLLFYAMQNEALKHAKLPPTRSPRSTRCPASRRSAAMVAASR
jgi:hypothetical protein